MDNELYLRVRSGLELFYYGNGIIIDFHSSTISYVVDMEMEVVKLADGTKRVRDIIDRFPQKEKEVYQAIERLVSRGIIRLRNDIKIVEILVNGEYGKFYPKEIIIELTNRCNFSCPFCYKNAQKNGNFLDYNEIAKIYHLIRGKVKYIQLTGGEPTMHPDFEKIVELLTQECQVNIVTNGSFLYEKNPYIISKLSDIQFSVYGLSDSEYFINTGVNDGFSKLEKSIDLVRKYNIPFSLSATLHRENIEKLEEYVISAINLGAKILKVGAADLFGREKRKTSLELDYVEKKSELAEKILRVKKKYHSKINVLLNNIEIEEHIDNGKELLYRRNLKCGSGIDYVVISSKGSIRPCLYFDEEEISVGTISLLSDYINDGYEIEHLYQAIKNIFESGFYKDNSVSPCWALKKYYEEYIMEDKS